MNSNAHIQRPERFVSHALVELRKYKHFPFFIQSGILLDMSTSGFKAEFTANSVNVKLGRYYVDAYSADATGDKGDERFKL